MRNSKILNVLSLEDTIRDFELIRAKLIDAGYDLKIERVEKEVEFTVALRNNHYDIILADFQLPGFNAFEALRLHNEICPHVPFVCVSGVIGEETAIELIRLGAVDYVLKDHLIRLPFVVKRALDEASEKEARRQAEEAVKISQQMLTMSLENLKGTSLLFGDRNYHFLYFNKAQSDLMKRTFNGDIKPGMNILECITSNFERNLFRENYNRALKGESFSDVRLMGDAELVWYEYFYNPIFDENGIITGVIILGINITGRKHAELELEKWANLFRPKTN